jgi:pimeloyl-ACP methyl ester carboxylesterase
MRQVAIMMRPLLFLLASIMWAAPCTTADSACTEWIRFSGSPARSLVYRTFPLDTRNDGITRALIVVHGAGRDADNYFRSALAATFLAGALEDTIVISPRFASNNGTPASEGGCADTLAPNEVNWSCTGNSWRYGGNAIGNDQLTSFDLADQILRQVARKEVFPNLKTIVVAGHSAGGMFVVRYAMANQVHDELGVPIMYVVANPSSYPYLDALRPVSSAWSSTASAPGYIPAAPAGDDFRAFGDAKNCSTYDQWPYGLQNRAGYTARLTDDQLRKQLAARPTTYMLGELDILPLASFDSSCPAMAQGPTRLARGQAFSKYVSEKYGAQHKMMVVPLCGHNARCMFTAEPALPILFPKP